MNQISFYSEGEEWGISGGLSLGGGGGVGFLGLGGEGTFLTAYPLLEY